MTSKRVLYNLPKLIERQSVLATLLQNFLIYYLKVKTEWQVILQIYSREKRSNHTHSLICSKYEIFDVIMSFLSTVNLQNNLSFSFCYIYYLVNLTIGRFHRYIVIYLDLIKGSKRLV